MHIQIHHDPSRAIPPFEGTLGRITAFLGANGAGKSKLLDAIMDRFEGHVGHKRLLRFVPLGTLGNQHFENPQPLESTEKSLLSLQEHHRRHATNQDRFYLTESEILRSLNAIDLKREREERAAYHKHLADKENVPAPEHTKPSFEELCDIFNAVVDVSLTYNYDTARFEVRSNRYESDPYAIDKLSSGEQWIFRTLPAFIKFKDDHMVVFVDEPETQLNEQLAIEFWTYIEQQRPNWKFIYATHNVSFASRQSINDVYLLRSPSKPPQPINHIAELPREEKRALLGIGPRLALTKLALFVEGEDTSIDVPFYRTLLNREDILITSLGGSKSVLQATAQSGYWEQLELTEITAKGSIDRDFMLDASSLPSGVTALELHDVEAYLCLPNLLARVGAHTAGCKDEGTYIDLIVEHCKTQRESTIYQHTDRLFPTKSSMSVPKHERISGDASVISGAYCKNRDQLISKIQTSFDDRTINKLVAKVVSEIDTALASRNVKKLLVWFSGKGLIEKLCEPAQIRDKSQAINLINELSFVDVVAELAAMRKKLRALFPSAKE